MANASDYPLPSNAAYIWTNGEFIFLTFPGYKGNEDRRFNTVQLRPEIETTTTKVCVCGRCENPTEVTIKVKNPILEVLWDVLKNRSLASSDERKIGSKATPTQWNIDAVLKSMKVNRIEPKKDVSDQDTDTLLASIGL